MPKEKGKKKPRTYISCVIRVASFHKVLLHLLNRAAQKKEKQEDGESKINHCKISIVNTKSYETSVERTPEPCNHGKLSQSAS